MVDIELMERVLTSNLGASSEPSGIVGVDHGEEDGGGQVCRGKYKIGELCLLEGMDGRSEASALGIMV
jgi:hypothetical protein